MTKFEYSTLVFEVMKLLGGAKLDHEALHKKLNEYGAEGWELVNVFSLSRIEGTTHEITAVFKRAIK
jgi:hypothetical protein